MQGLRIAGKIEDHPTLDFTLLDYFRGSGEIVARGCRAEPLPEPAKAVKILVESRDFGSIVRRDIGVGLCCREYAGESGRQGRPSLSEAQFADRSSLPTGNCMRIRVSGPWPGFV
jgi:hypothetical protein